MNQRIVGLVREQLTVYVDGLDLPSTVTFTVASYTQPTTPPDGYRAAVTRPVLPIPD